MLVVSFAVSVCWLIFKSSLSALSSIRSDHLVLVPCLLCPLIHQEEHVGMLIANGGDTLLMSSRHWTSGYRGISISGGDL